jgi:amino acid adenylation domain-containing protein
MDCEQTLVQCFENIAAKYSGRLAVKMGDRSLTYEQMNCAANRIARAALDKLGPGNEPVALLFEHGIDVIAALLGVMKAGKFYVALDPSFPEQRSRDILQDCGAKLIVTNGRNASLASRFARLNTKTLDIEEAKANSSGDKPDTSISSDDFAYMTYTSGSTGKPKGVPRKHGHALIRQRLKTKESPVNVSDSLSLLHSIVFGSSTNCLYQSLLNGASLFPFDVRNGSIELLVRWLREEGITVLHTPPALFRQIALALSKEKKLPPLRLIRLSGSPVTRQDFELYKQTFSRSTLLEINMGSTEAANMTVAFINHSFVYPEEGIPVGFPALGKQIFLVDESGREVAPGEVGEIAVKSAHLNEGYWGQEELTKNKFVQDSEGGEVRTYFTGDLGKFLPDGFLIHLGRKDFTVKIRGYRVEFGDVEKALQSHPEVREACVTAWEREDGEKYLAAYVVARDGVKPTFDELRRFLRQKLPDYMLPSVFLFQDSLPLINGKLDRRRLPKPDTQRPELSRSYVTPRNESERMLAEIWSQVLALDRVGIHDDFFELGGHSLAATRVVSRVIEKFGLELPVKSLFQSPTIADMARVVEACHEPASEKEVERLLAEIESMSEKEARDRFSAYRRDGY